MRVLVTGAFGFIGLNPIEALLARGDVVIAVDLGRLPEAAARALAAHRARLSTVNADVRDERFVQTLFAAHRPDAVVLAAERLAIRFGELAGLEVIAARLGAAFGPWEADTGVRDTLSPHFQLSRHALRGTEAVLPRRSALDWNYSRNAAAALSYCWTDRCASASSISGPHLVRSRAILRDARYELPAIPLALRRRGGCDDRSAWRARPCAARHRSTPRDGVHKSLH
jgi:nucleoside-diphosphate-sugar epimerase